MVVSVNVGHVRQMGIEGAEDPMDRPWRSGIFKLPVQGSVRLTRTGLTGDERAIVSAHGGSEMAVLGYAASHYGVWRAELGRADLPFGTFGENLTISGQDEESVCVGDTYAIGSARLQVSLPRLPCWKLARRLRVGDMIERVDHGARGGWYMRVLDEGVVGRGDSVLLVERPYPRWPVARAYRVYGRREEDRSAAAELAACELLSDSWRTKLSGAPPEPRS